MNSIFKRIATRMVYETGGPSLVPKHLLTLNGRSEAHLASKQNGIERRSYEVCICMFEPVLLIKFNKRI